MRLLHTADWHLGHHLHGFERSHEQACFLDWLIGLIHERQIDGLLIAGDLFKSEISPKRVSTSIGIMNLVSAPLGGIPVCHGAGGVAALYRYGASTSVANFIAGTVLIVIAIYSADQGIVTLFPVGLLGSLLFFVAIDLARSGLKTTSFPSTLVTGIVSVATSMTIGFLAGVIVWLIQRSYSRR